MLSSQSFRKKKICKCRCLYDETLRLFLDFVLFLTSSFLNNQNNQNVKAQFFFFFHDVNNSPPTHPSLHHFFFSFPKLNHVHAFHLFPYTFILAAICSVGFYGAGSNCFACSVGSFQPSVVAVNVATCTNCASGKL